MKPELTYKGTFNLILGSMWSGKTSELVRRYQRYSIVGKKCLMIKYKNDIRYNESMVVTHDKIKVEALACEYLYEADDIIKNFDIVCIDEVQFYKDAHIFIDKWANMGKIVEACGLTGTFNRTPFPIISKLVPLAENLTFLKAVCRETGNDAVFTHIHINPSEYIHVNASENELELIGGAEKYSAVDRQTYYKNKSFYTFDLIKEFMEIYADRHNIHIDPIIGDEQLKIFMEENKKLEMCDLVKKFVMEL